MAKQWGLGQVRGKSLILLTAYGKMGKIEKNEKFHLWGLLMDVFIGFLGLGHFFIPKLMSHKQKSHGRSILCYFSKFGKSAVPTPHCARKNFFDMPFLMSHGGVFHRGSKLANFEKVYHTVCVLQRLCLLKGDFIQNFILS